MPIKTVTTVEKRVTRTTTITIGVKQIIDTLLEHMIELPDNLPANTTMNIEVFNDGDFEQMKLTTGGNLTITYIRQETDYEEYEGSGL